MTATVTGDHARPMNVYPFNPLWKHILPHVAALAVDRALWVFTDEGFVGDFTRLQERLPSRLSEYYTPDLLREMLCRMIVLQNKLRAAEPSFPLSECLADEFCLTIAIDVARIELAAQGHDASLCERFEDWTLDVTGCELLYEDTFLGMGEPHETPEAVVPELHPDHWFDRFERETALLRREVNAMRDATLAEAERAQAGDEARDG